MADFLDTYMEIPALLKDPFDLHGGMIRRRQLAKVLLRRLDLIHRTEPTEQEIDNDLRPESYRAVLKMIDGLVDLLDTRRVDVTASAALLCQQPSLLAAADLLLDFGWGHVEVKGGPARLVVDNLRAAYIDQMKPRVLRLLRQLESRGFLVDTPRVAD